MAKWINSKKPFRRGHFGESCYQCHPKLCSCPMTLDDELNALQSALSEDVWIDEEVAVLKEKIKNLEERKSLC